MNYNNLCYRCFCEKPIREKPCPKCGYENNSAASNCLLPGTILKGRYIVGAALGVGGFGITYKCLDTQVGGICAIKEYFPAKYAMRDAGQSAVSVAGENLERYNRIMNRFVEEAELVKKLHHRNVITIYDSFFENSTAYYVMEYCDGIDLRRYTANFTRRLDYDEGMNILFQIMNGLEYIHAMGILHRDIAPDNIYVTKNNSVKILDFGSARREMDQYNKELSVIVKVGYAPIEQYGGQGKQGPFTDIYALGATFYHLFTGVTPVESTQRVSEDSMTPFSQLRPDLPDNLKFCMERCMALPSSQRVGSIQQMKAILGLTSVSVEVPRSAGVPSGVPSGTPSATPAEVPPRTSKATVAIRIGASLIDFSIWGFLYFAMVCGVLGFTIPALIILCMFPLVFTAINTVFELVCARTLGKLMCGLYVRGRQTEEVTVSQILLRNIIKNLNIFAIIFSNGDDLFEDIVTDSTVYKKE